MTNEEMTKLFEAEKLRREPDGRIVYACAMLGHKGRINIGDEVSVFDSWCYGSIPQAIAAMDAWNPAEQKEPEGWFRHVQSGRRRPNGDKSKEYIRA